MDDRRRGPGRRANRSTTPAVECLDSRVLLSAVSARASANGVGQYISPGVIRPRTVGTPVVLDAVPSLNRYLIPLLGRDSLEQIKNQAAARNVPQSAQVAQRVVSQPFIRTMMGNYDTYQLLNSPAMQLLVGYTEISDLSADTTSVRYLLDASSLASVGANVTVQIPPSADAAGFLATVPGKNVRLRSDGYYSVDIPTDQIPQGAPTPESIVVLAGQLADTYAATGPILQQSLLTGQHRRGPNTPQIVRGLRLARYLSNPRLFPVGLQGQYLRLMRVAVERDAFQPTADQSQLIQDTLNEFVQEVSALQASGTFQPDVPPSTDPDPLSGPALSGSLVISAGAFRDLFNVAPGVDGLPLLGLNFPGRIDAGFVIAPNGDYGLLLTARGPLQSAPAGFTSDVIGGDVRVEVSDSQSLSELNGLRVEEGTTVGTVLSGAVTASKTTVNGANGTHSLRVLGASAGYGTGLSFGTGYSYTRVIPLGNLNALIPQYPRV